MLITEDGSFNLSGEILKTVDEIEEFMEKNKRQYMNKTILKNYAKLIARVGVNVQKGQGVNITANVNDEYFVKQRGLNLQKV